MAEAANVFFNYSSSYKGKCFDINAEPDNLGADMGWNFQVYFFVTIVNLV